MSSRRAPRARAAARCRGSPRARARRRARSSRRHALERSSAGRPLDRHVASIACESASMPAYAVTRGGAPTVSSGSQIADRGIRYGLEMPDLHAELRIADDGDRRDLRAGAGGGRKGDQRDDGPGYEMLAVVAARRPAVGEQQRGHLREVDRAPAADRDDHVGRRRRGRARRRRRSSPSGRRPRRRRTPRPRGPRPQASARRSRIPSVAAIPASVQTRTRRPWRAATRPAARPSRVRR